MSQFNYRASFANATSRLTEVVQNLRTVPPASIPAEMVAIANCTTLKGVEGKSIALALVVGKWIQDSEDTAILAAFDFSKVEAKDLAEKQAETLLTCAKQAYACRAWATLSVKVKA